MNSMALMVEAVIRSHEVLNEQHKNCGGGEDTIYAEPLSIAYAALNAFVNTGKACFVDVLNPCWDNRPTDRVGKHWAGDIPACPYCHARGVLFTIDSETEDRS